MAIPFRLLCDALTQLSLDPLEQRNVLVGSVVTDEFALDLDNAVRSLQYESQHQPVPNWVVHTPTWADVEAAITARTPAGLR